MLDLLAAEGCREDRVALAHVDRNPDPGLHVELAARGAYLGYDGAARHQRWPDSVLVDCLAAAVEGGAGERLLLGGDVARRTPVRELRRHARARLPVRPFRAPPAYGGRGRALWRRVLVANPARWLSWEPEP